MKFYLAALFILEMFLYTCLVKLSIILPVRNLLLVFLFFVIMVAYRSEVFAFVRAHLLTASVFLALIIVGGLIAFLNERSIGTIIQYALSDVIQPFLILVSTYVIARLTSPGFVAGVLIGFAGLTGAVAVAQFAGVEPAWHIRMWLNEFQDITEQLDRPMGLSLTPIVFSYHIASAYVAASIFYHRQMISTSAYGSIVFAALVMAAVSGTRSVLLGIILQELLQVVTRRRFGSLLWATGLGIVCLAGLAYLETIGSRVASASDTSALERMVLNNFGIRLAWDYPFGLGWGFEPGDLAWLYWQDLSNYVSSDSIFRLGIHNSYINFFLTYGLFGVAAVVLAVLIRVRKAVTLLFSFTAYFINALFHNDGPFIGEYYFWFAFALLVYVWDSEAVPAPMRSGRRPAAQSARTAPLPTPAPGR